MKKVKERERRETEGGERRQWEGKDEGEGEGEKGAMFRYKGSGKETNKMRLNGSTCLCVTTIHTQRSSRGELTAK